MSASKRNSPAKSATLLQLAEAWLEERQKQVSEATHAYEHRQLFAMLAFFGDRPFRKQGLELVEEIARRLQDWLDSMAGRVSNRTIKEKYAITAKRFFNYCVRRGFLYHNPGRFVRTPRVMHKTHPLFTHEEYLRITEATRGTPLYWLVVCAYRTGLDMVDICLLRWESVDLENLVIHVQRRKMRHTGVGEVTVPILPGSDLHEVLELLKEVPQEDRFPGPGFVCHELALLYTGNHNAVKERHVRLLQRLGITGRTFKSWRRTFLSALANSGAATAMTCKMSGHANPAMLARYVKPDVDAMRYALVKANDFMERDHIKRITLK